MFNQQKVIFIFHFWSAVFLPRLRFPPIMDQLPFCGFSMSLSENAAWSLLLSPGSWNPRENGRLRALKDLWSSGDLSVDPATPDVNGVPLGLRVLHDAVSARSGGYSGVKPSTVDPEHLDLFSGFLDLLRSRGVRFSFLGSPPDAGWHGVFNLGDLVSLGAHSQGAGEYAERWSLPLLDALRSDLPDLRWGRGDPCNASQLCVDLFGGSRSQVGPLFGLLKDQGLLSRACADDLIGCRNPDLAREFYRLGVLPGAMLSDGRLLGDVWSQEKFIPGDMPMDVREQILDLTGIPTSELRSRLRSSGVSLHRKFHVPAYGVLDLTAFPDHARPDLGGQVPSATDLTLFDEVCIRAVSHVPDLFSGLQSGSPNSRPRIRVAASLRMLRSSAGTTKSPFSDKSLDRLDLAQAFTEAPVPGEGLPHLRDLVSRGLLPQIMQAFREDLSDGLYAQPVEILRGVYGLLLSQCWLEAGRDLKGSIPEDLVNEFWSHSAFMGEFASEMPDLPVRDDLLPEDLSGAVKLAARQSHMWRFGKETDTFSPLCFVRSWFPEGFPSVAADGIRRRNPPPPFISDVGILNVLVDRARPSDLPAALASFLCMGLPVFGNGLRRFERGDPSKTELVCGFVIDEVGRPRRDQVVGGMERCLGAGAKSVPAWAEPLCSLFLPGAIPEGRIWALEPPGADPPKVFWMLDIHQARHGAKPDLDNTGISGFMQDVSRCCSVPMVSAAVSRSAPALPGSGSADALVSPALPQSGVPVALRTPIKPG